MRCKELRKNQWCFSDYTITEVYAGGYLNSFAKKLDLATITCSMVAGLLETSKDQRFYVSLSCYVLLCYCHGNGMSYCVIITTHLIVSLSSHVLFYYHSMYNNNNNTCFIVPLTGYHKSVTV